MVESDKLPETLVSSPSMFSVFKGKAPKFIYVNVDTSGPHVNILFKESPFLERRRSARLHTAYNGGKVRYDHPT